MPSTKRPNAKRKSKTKAFFSHPLRAPASPPPWSTQPVRPRAPCTCTHPPLLDTSGECLAPHLTPSERLPHHHLGRPDIRLEPHIYSTPISGHLIPVFDLSTFSACCAPPLCVAQLLSILRWDLPSCCVCVGHNAGTRGCVGARGGGGLVR
jgi:hypothetical protein